MDGIKPPPSMTYINSDPDLFLSLLDEFARVAKNRGTNTSVSFRLTLNAARLMVDKNDKVQALVRLSEITMLVDLDQALIVAKEALEVSDTIVDRVSNRINAHRMVSKAFLNISEKFLLEKDYTKALDIAHDIYDEHSRAFALSYISTQLAKTNDLDRALILANEALDAAKLMLDSVGQSYVFLSVCEIFCLISQKLAGKEGGDETPDLIKQAKIIADAIGWKNQKDRAHRLIEETLATLNTPIKPSSTAAVQEIPPSSL